MIRCPACRGAKKVAKLGGMTGDCNCCLGKGEIKESDRPVMVMAPIPEPVAEIVRATSEAFAVSPEPVTQELPLKVKVSSQSEPARSDRPNIYKRKGG